MLICMLVFFICVFILFVLCVVLFGVNHNSQKKDVFDNVFFTPNKKTTHKEHDKLVKEHLHRSTGNDESKCPYCNSVLAVFPTRKINCLKCKKTIYVVKRPYDSKNVLATEKDKTILDKDRENLKYYFWQDDFFEYEKKLKEIRKGGYTPPSDVYWYKLQCKALIAFANKDYQELKMIYYSRARERFRNKKYDEALEYFLQADYIDACGATCNGFLYENNDAAIKKTELSFMLLGNIGRCITNLNLSEDELVNVFLNADFEYLPYPFKRSVFVPAIRTNYRNMVKTLKS